MSQMNAHSRQLCKVMSQMNAHSRQTVCETGSFSVYIMSLITLEINLILLCNCMKVSFFLSFFLSFSVYIILCTYANTLFYHNYKQ
jgi:hypothetical protein